MPDISQYAELIKTIISEGVKYFVLLLFAILAIRFWKNASRVSADRKTKAYVFAGVATVMALGIGYASFRHSMARLYSHYGMQAFDSRNVSSALSLFQTSDNYWRTADAVGGEGVCVTLLGKPDIGKQFLDEAKRMRKGAATPFEEFNQGIAYFASGNWDAAVPLLESSSRDTSYEWSVTKLLCVITLETNDVADATRMLKPFAAVEVQQADHAYIVARLALAEGRTNDARVLIDKFDTPDCPPLFKGRLESLKAKLQN